MRSFNSFDSIFKSLAMDVLMTLPCSKGLRLACAMPAPVQLYSTVVCRYSTRPHEGSGPAAATAAPGLNYCEKGAVIVYLKWETPFPSSGCTDTCVRIGLNTGFI